MADYKFFLIGKEYIDKEIGEIKIIFEKQTKEILELEYKNVDDARKMSEKISGLLNSKDEFICFGPDDHGKQKCFARVDIDDVLCEFIEDPEAEKEKSLLEQIKEKVDRIADRSHDHSVPFIPYVEPWHPKPYFPPTVVTYMVQFPPDNTSWYWSSGTGSTITFNDSDNSTNLSAETVTGWKKITESSRF